MALITLNGVSKAYPAPKRGAEPILAVDDVSVEVEEGSVTAVIGYSGAGKSTLARLINALEPATSGLSG
ncbi:MAG: ATP-binding cassette domain-containing protein [Pseudoclavibacter sp.]